MAAQIVHHFVQAMRLVLIECGVVSPWEPIDPRTVSLSLAGALKGILLQHRAPVELTRGQSMQILTADPEVALYIDELAAVLPALAETTTDYRVLHRGIDTMALFISKLRFQSCNPSKQRDYDAFVQEILAGNESMWRQRFRAPHLASYEQPKLEHGQFRPQHQPQQEVGGAQTANWGSSQVSALRLQGQMSEAHSTFYQPHASALNSTNNFHQSLAIESGFALPRDPSFRSHFGDVSQTADTFGRPTYSKNVSPPRGVAEATMMPSHSSMGGPVRPSTLLDPRLAYPLSPKPISPRRERSPVRGGAVLAEPQDSDSYRWAKKQVDSERYPGGISANQSHSLMHADQSSSYPQRESMSFSQQQASALEPSLLHLQPYQQQNQQQGSQFGGIRGRPVPNPPVLAFTHKSVSPVRDRGRTAAMQAAQQTLGTADSSIYRLPTPEVGHGHQNNATANGSFGNGGGSGSTYSVTRFGSQPQQATYPAPGSSPRPGDSFMQQRKLPETDRPVPEVQPSAIHGMKRRSTVR